MHDMNVLLPQRLTFILCMLFWYSQPTPNVFKFASMSLFFLHSENGTSGKTNHTSLLDAEREVVCTYINNIQCVCVSNFSYLHLHNYAESRK